MEETVTVAQLLNELCVAIPSIIVGSQALTAALRGVFNIEKGNIVHTLNWIIGILTGIGFVVFNGLTFGLSTWADILVGAIAGLIGAGASNGLYEWSTIKTLFSALADLLGNLFHKENYYKNQASA